jgi:hypothetical protein
MKVKIVKTEPLNCACTHKVNIDLSLKFLIKIIIICFNACLTIYINVHLPTKTNYPLILA